MTARRFPLSSISFGLAIALTLGTYLVEGSAWAAPPDGTEAPGEAEPPAEEVAVADEIAPAEEAPAEEVAPTDEVVPTEEPEPVPAPEPEPISEVPAVEAPPGPDLSKIGDKHSIQYSSLLAPRINPLGLEERLWIGYQYRLYNKDKTILNGSNIAIFFRPIVNPAIVLVGPTIQFQPAAVLRLRASYAYVYYLGSFQYMQSYKSPYDDYSETRLDAQADFDESNYSIGGHQVELEALFQIKVKNLAIRNTLFGIYNNFDLRGDDDVFYAPRYEIMVPGQGWLLANDTDLLWLQPMKGTRNATLMAGARATTLMPFFPDEVYEDGEEIDNPIGPQFRLGPAIGYIFYDKPERKFNKPTLLMMPQWNILHRWRTGRDVITPYPTIIIAFAFSGQLWGKN